MDEDDEVYEDVQTPVTGKRQRYTYGQKGGMAGFM
jgi:hypothetical protein